MFPDLPAVPSNTLPEVGHSVGGDSAGGEDVDFDDLTRMIIKLSISTVEEMSVAPCLKRCFRNRRSKSVLPFLQVCVTANVAMSSTKERVF